DIRFEINVQHDCQTGGCVPDGTKAVLQEREITNLTIPTLAHKDDKHYIINLAAFHNACLLRQALPQPLTQPYPIQKNRREFHDTLAAQLHMSQSSKRKKMQEKAATTRDQNKAKEKALKSTEQRGISWYGLMLMLTMPK
ncbi:hypothetical protein JB92DRAFT_2710886, partial [Gautieria morchelliformis]